MVKKTGWFLFFVLMAAACLEEPECFSLNNHLVGIAFKKMSDNRADTVVFTSVTADGTDNAFISAPTAMTGIDKLSLNYFQDSTIFHFTAPDRIYDLDLRYLAQAQFVSEDCGHRFVLGNLRSGAGTSFDSVRILNPVPKPNLATGTNIEIYRCPNTSRVKLAFSTQVAIRTITTDYPAFILFDENPRSTINIPLNTAALVSNVQFEFTDGTIKTLRLEYNNEERTLFETCGPQPVLSGFRVVTEGTTFTTVQVVRNTIQDPPLTNLAITF